MFESLTVIYFLPVPQLLARGSLRLEAIPYGSYTYKPQPSELYNSVVDEFFYVHFTITYLESHVNPNPTPK